VESNLEAGVLKQKTPKQVEEFKEKMKQKMLDDVRLFSEVFNSKKGQKIIEYLEAHSHINFPNYGDVNATFSKIGEQQLVDKIKAMAKKGKEFG